MDEQPEQKKISGGSFKTMNLLFQLQKAIQKKGFMNPTPIQRKCIPLLLQGKDLVAMARTGSGKTAAFLIPLIQKLKAHSPFGFRGLILSPSRELAVQTLGVLKDLTKGLDLKLSAVIGGDKLEDQFSEITKNPDVIVATPGRFLHLVIEMKLSLKTIEYVVFDEADRLFEMGFSEQLNEILSRLPSSRQTCLFSATLPKSLVDFANAGLSNPELIRLDLESKISQDLEMLFFSVKTDYKDSALLLLLEKIPKEEQVLIFTATKHHVEYIQELCNDFNFNACHIYGSMDQEARTNSITDFTLKKKQILIVTDVAARGIDIPLLDNVIIFDFGAKPKLFVHRVGRVARAGRSGKAFCLVATDDLPFLFDLQMFLDKPISQENLNLKDNLIIGNLPQIELEDLFDRILQKSKGKQLEVLKKVSLNANKLYFKTRGTAERDSYRKAKELKVTRIHPFFEKSVDSKQVELLDSIKSFKPQGAIFDSKRKIKMQIEPELKKSKIEEENSKKNDSKKNVAVTTSNRDLSVFMNYSSKVDQGEKGFQMESSFAEKATKSLFDISADDPDAMKRQQNSLKWDKKKGKYIRQQDNRKMIKTESGHKIPASYSSGIYEDWQKKSRGKAAKKSKYQPEDLGDDLQDSKPKDHKTYHDKSTKPNFRKDEKSYPDRSNKSNSKPKFENSKPKFDHVKNKDQILKDRRKNETNKSKNAPKKFNNKR